jgi:hypothetical protein
MEPRPAGSSNRAFGLVFTGFFVLVALAPLVRGAPVRTWALMLAAAFLVAALAFPRALAPLNRAWTLLGDLLHRVTTPIALAVLFFGVVTPTAFLMRLLGKDPLRLRRAPAEMSYWIERVPPGPEPDSLRNQF